MRNPKLMHTAWESAIGGSGPHHKTERHGWTWQAPYGQTHAPNGDLHEQTKRQAGTRASSSRVTHAEQQCRGPIVCATEGRAETERTKRAG